MYSDDGVIGPGNGDLNVQFGFEYYDYEEIAEEEAFEKRYEAARQATLTDQQKENEKKAAEEYEKAKKIFCDA